MSGDDLNREQALAELEGDQLIDRQIAAELGEELATQLGRIRRSLEAADHDRHSGEGLRERKKRLTRQRISDLATALFISRGFDNVKVSEIADRAGVSEKTVYNYFPTKESLVIDQPDEEIGRLAELLRGRQPQQSPTRVVVEAIKSDMARFDVVRDDGAAGFMMRFLELISSTPSLRAAWADFDHRLFEAARDALAHDADVDPRDPEPTIAAHVLIALHELSFEALFTHISEGLLGPELVATVHRDIDRAARLLDTGLWSFDLLARGVRTKQQIQEARQAAELARDQVVDAIRQARAAWQELRREQHAGHGRGRPYGRRQSRS
jgi:AcrR family transcriptional regulator